MYPLNKLQNVINFLSGRHRLLMKISAVVGRFKVRFCLTELFSNVQRIDSVLAQCYTTFPHMRQALNSQRHMTNVAS
jgi:hypothetical protein